MGRRPDSFARKGAVLAPQPLILVLCEDAESSRRYFLDACDHFRIKVHVEVTHCGRTDPLGIVKEALARSRKFDTVYCAIDRDSHEHFDRALALANGHAKVKIIASYPCFEYWLLLHFCETRRPYQRRGTLSPGDELVRHLRSFPEMSAYEKGAIEGLFAALLGRLSVAHRRAQRALADAEATGEPNPSTQVHQLISKFSDLALDA